MKRPLSMAVCSAAICVAVSAFADVYTSASYVQQGLVAQWDAIDNAGVGYHVPDAATWKDLAGTCDLTLIAGGSWTAAGNSLTVNKGAARGNTKAPAYKTIEVVCKVTSSGKNANLMFSSGISSRKYALFGGNGTTAYFDTGSDTLCAKWTYDASAIRMMAATYASDGTVDAVYKDGAAANDGTYKETWGNPESKAMIGDRSATASKYAWFGEIYTIRLYSTALTPEQIAANHAVDVARFQVTAPRIVQKPEILGDNMTVKFTAGQTGDSHALRLVWDTTLADHGIDYASWPNNEKVADIADGATSTTFAVPAAIFAAGQVCCRAVLTKQDGTPVAVSLPLTSLTINPAADYVLAGPTLFYAPAGTTNVYSGLISGTGPAIIDGGGTVAFSHMNNTYSGGTLISNAVFRLDADGCAGLAAVTAAVNKAHVFMNCANVPNSFRFLQPYTANASDFWLGQHPAANALPIYPLISSGITVTGDVSFAGNVTYMSGSRVDPLIQNPTVTYKGKFAADPGFGISVGTYGKSVFEGRYLACQDRQHRDLFGVNASGRGQIEFHSSSNEMKLMSLYNAKLHFMAKDAFPDSLLWFQYGGDDCKVFLYGNDQTIAGIGFGNDSNAPKMTENSTGQCLTSVDDPATVRIVGCDKSTIYSSVTLTHKIALFGKITLVMDVDPTFTSSGFYEDFSVRKSTMSGDLIISNGDFRVSSTASFPNVPNIYVGDGGSFTCSTTRANAFVGCTNLVVKGTMAFDNAVTDPFGYKTMALTLGSGANLSLPAGSTLTVTSLKVGDTEMTDGRYGDGGTALTQISRGSVVVQGVHENVSATWTGGGGSDTSVGTAANWGAEEAPNLQSGAVLATFATGGTSADFDRDVFLRGIALSKPDTGFSLTGAGRTISLDSEGLAFNDVTPAADGSPRTYTIEPVVMQSAMLDQAIAIPTNVTFAFAGGYQQGMGSSNTKTGDGTLVLGGNGATPGSWRFDGGTTVLSGTNRIDGKIEATNSTIRFCGTVTQAGGPATATYYYGWRPGASDMVVRCKPVSGLVPNSRMFFENVDIGKTLAMYCPSLDAGQGWFNVVAGTTNIFRSMVYFMDYIGHLNFGDGSVTKFLGDLAIAGQTEIHGNATILLAGATPFTSGGGYRVRERMVVRVEKAGQLSGGGSMIMQDNSRLETAVDNAFSQTPSRDYWLLLYNTSTLDISNTVQNLVLFGANSNGNRDGYASATVTGLPGSELRIRRGYIFHNVTNSVSLTMTGTNVNEVLVATNKAFASCGDVKVAGGILDFAHNASWRNGTNVTVCGGATLRINQSKTFGEHAQLHAEGEGWSIALGTGVVQKFSSFDIGGTKQPPGLYGAVGNASAKYKLTNFTGTGLIKVGKFGTAVVIR